jgi:hypothetical protein
MRIPGIAAIVGFLMLATSACAFFSRGESSAPSLLDSEVSVAVDNRNWNDITVYLLTGGLPQRLGMVTALSKGSFAFPSQRINTGNVRLRALPVAGRPYTSESILVQPGQEIVWTLENDLDISSLSVY